MPTVEGVAASRSRYRDKGSHAEPVSGENPRERKGRWRPLRASHLLQSGGGTQPWSRRDDRHRSSGGRLGRGAGARRQCLRARTGRRWLAAARPPRQRGATARPLRDAHAPRSGWGEAPGGRRCNRVPSGPRRCTQLGQPLRRPRALPRGLHDQPPPNVVEYPDIGAILVVLASSAWPIRTAPTSIKRASSPKRCGRPTKAPDLGRLRKTAHATAKRSLARRSPAPRPRSSCCLVSET